MQESERQLICEIVEAELAKRGLDAENPNDDAETWRWLRSHKGAFDSAGHWTWRGVVLAVLAAFFAVVGEGIKALIERLSS